MIATSDHAGYPSRPPEADTVLSTGTDTTCSGTWAFLQAALVHRQAVTVSYHGRSRVICPHALGWKKHRAMVLGYQVGGQTSTGVLDPDPRRRWRCMFVDEIADVVTAAPIAWGTADNYNPRRPFTAIDRVTLAVSGARPV